MGFISEFNWVLKLSDLNESVLNEGMCYSFRKSGARIYPIKMPIDLLNTNWEPVGRCVINSFTVTENETTGCYTILELYSQETRELLSHQYRSFVK